MGAFLEGVKQRDAPGWTRGIAFGGAGFRALDVGCRVFGSRVFGSRGSEPGIVYDISPACLGAVNAADAADVFPADSEGVEGNADGGEGHLAGTIIAPADRLFVATANATCVEPPSEDGVECYADGRIGDLGGGTRTPAVNLLVVAANAANMMPPRG